MSSGPLPSTDIVPATPPFTFQPPPGGDISLNSCDGTVFRVHSFMLALSSTVFEGMFSGADTRADTIDLAEDAEAISLMLAFIYPTTLPSITNLGVLEKSMPVAHKYDIRRITELIEGLFQSDNALLAFDPIRIFSASAKYNFGSIRKMAAKSLCLSGRDLLSIDGLTRLAAALPETSHTVGLVGAPSLRMKTLDELLFVGPLASRIYPTYSQSHATDNGYSSYMICPTCWKSRRLPVVAGASYYVPGWYHHWALQLRAALLQNPISSCERYFNISCILGFQGTETEACASCVSYTTSRGLVFNAWGERVRRKIQDALELLDVVFSL